jgi:hypothetical protein
VINNNEYISIIEKQFLFLVKELNYKVVHKKRNVSFLYDVNYQKGNSMISVSFDNRENYLQVILFILKDGQLPDYDDKVHTIHLEKLNNMILPLLTIEEINENNELFQNIKPLNQFEKRLIKSAKELRLCLKKRDLLFK